MKCPKCHCILTKSSWPCHECGYRFNPDFQSKLNSYFELKKEIDNLHSITQNQLLTGIDLLYKKLRKYFIDERDLLPIQKEDIKPKVIEKINEPVLSVLSSENKAEKQKNELLFETAFGQKWLLLIGILATVFGVGYFLKYSFEQGWIGPAARVSLAYIWGAAFLVGGELFRRRKMETFGFYLVGGGIATLYFATFAAFQLYHLIGQWPAFILMIMVTFLAGLLSVIYNAKWLAVIAIIGGFLTPMLLSTGQDNQLVLMSYMTILNLGLFGIAIYKKWNLLTMLGFIFTYLLYSGWYFNHYTSEKFWPALIFLTIFYLIYSIMPFLSRFMKEKLGNRGDFVLIIPNSFITFGFSYYMVKSYFSVEAVGVISLFYAAVFLSMASYAFKAGKKDMEGFTVLVAKSLMFLIITVPLIFSGQWIIIFWSAQAIAMLWIGIKLENKFLSRVALLLFAFSSIKLFFYDYPNIFGLQSDFHILPKYGYLAIERWITSLILIILLYASGKISESNQLSLSDFPEKKTHPEIYVAFGLLLFIFLNLETASCFYDFLPAARFAAISVLWTVFSVGLIIKGFQIGSAPLRKTALMLFVVTIIKVFLFDMANISTPYRIISLIILGIFLISTSYLYHKFKHKLLLENSSKKEG